MFKPRFSLFTLVLACACAVVITIAGVMALVQKAAGNSAAGMVFLKTLVTVRDNYVEPVESEKLFDGATAGMVKALGDPYSAYLDKKSFSEITDLTDGVFGGIGVVLGKKDNDFVVVAPMEGTPGDEAGIKAGDKILAVDGTSVEGMQLEDVVGKIRGKQGTEVELKLADSSGAERTVRVIRGDIKVESVGGELLPGTNIGYIRISVFNEQTGNDFAKKYMELEKQGMKALVLDLRHNPGGILGECVKVAQYIVPKGTVVSIKDRNGNTYVEESNLEKVKYPLAVLVDHGSASAAEIVAGAVQDTGAGKLFGVQTFGKGSVQSVYKLSENTGLKLTTAKYYTPSGRSIHGTGIKPDVEIELDLNGMTDNQLAAAENYLKEQLAK
ncbi:MAG: S41 family peptidase [Phascolarctobacterium sp.]|nr:MAG: S41 family peptidase [Phascolarctobacterium sp.]